MRCSSPASTGSCSTKKSWVVKSEMAIDMNRYLFLKEAPDGTWGWVLVGQRSCRKCLSESFLDVDSGQFHDVCRWSLHGCVHRLPLGLMWEKQPGYGKCPECGRFFAILGRGGGSGGIYVCFHVSVCVGYSRQVSPPAHQGLNVTVLSTVPHGVFEERVDPWKTGAQVCVNEQVKGGKRLPQQHTSVSGFEALYVARGVLLLHSHLLPQRLCSHSVDDTVANLQRAAHRVNGTRARTVLMAFPVWLYLFGLLSQAVGHRIWVNIFPLCSNAAEDICPSVQHLGREVCCGKEPLHTEESTCSCCWGRWPAADAGPWTDEPTLAAPAENNRPPGSSHLGERHANVWWSLRKVTFKCSPHVCVHMLISNGARILLCYATTIDKNINV